MYELHPPAEWKLFKDRPLPGPKKNPDGSLVYEQWTRPGQNRQPLLDFKLLPDKASFILTAAITHDVLTSLDFHCGSLVVP